MPLVNNKSSAPVTPAPATVQIAPREHKGVTVDTRYTPVSALLTRVEGSAWTVNYYSQVLNDDSALSGQNLSQNPIYQQYKLIRGMELKVTSPLSTSQDSESKAMTMTGAATVYPFLIPNEGDMFLADIGDGREGVFRVTNSERKAIFKDTCHVIEYILVEYSNLERREDLNSKVIQKLEFVRDFLEHGQNPLVYEDDYVVMQKLSVHYKNLVQRYFQSFLSREYGTLLLPSQTYPIYDPFLVDAVLSVFTADDTYLVREVRRLNCDGDDNLKVPQIWDALKHCNKSILKHCFRQIGLVSARSFERNAMMEGVYHSGVAYVIYPKNPELSEDYQRGHREKPLVEYELLDADSAVVSLADLLADTEFEGVTEPAISPIHAVNVDDFYVFSQAFYDNTDDNTQSELEITVREYLDKKAIDRQKLLHMAETSHAWSALSRFYYVPILLMMIKASIRSI